MPKIPLPNDYSAAAQYYDLFYSFWDDSGLYVELARRNGGPVLDAMCGTGRMTIPIARTGAKVVGVDVEQRVLDLLKLKLKKEKARVRSNVKTLRRDIVNGDLGGPYSLAVFAWGSLEEVPTTSKQEAAIRNVGRHMKPGGILALHMDNPYDVRSTKEIFKGVQTAEDGALVSMFQRIRRRNGSNSYDMLFRYKIEPPRGKPRELKTKITLTFPTKEQLVRMLTKAGFRVRNIYGDYDLRPFTSKCKYIIVIAKKI